MEGEKKKKVSFNGCLPFLRSITLWCMSLVWLHNSLRKKRIEREHEKEREKRRARERVLNTYCIIRWPPSVSRFFLSQKCCPYYTNLPPSHFLNQEVFVHIFEYFFHWFHPITLFYFQTIKSMFHFFFLISKLSYHIFDDEERTGQVIKIWMNFFTWIVTSVCSLKKGW